MSTPGELETPARRPARFMAVGLLLTLLVAAPARAGDDSEALFNSAVSAFGRREYRAAAVLFERAFVQSKLAQPIYNAGMSWKLAGEDARAADALSRALELAGLDPKQQEQALSAYEETTTHLGKIRVTGPEGSSVSVAHVERAPVPLSIHLPPGPHTIVAELKDGTVQRYPVVSKVGEPGTLQILEPAKPSSPPVAPPAAPPRGDTAPAPERSSSQPLLGWLSLGVGTAAVGVGAYFQLSALKDRDEWDELGHRRQHSDVRDRAATKNRVAIGSFIAGGALVATGVTLLLTSPSTEKPPSSRVAVSFAPGHFMIDGRF